MRRGSCAKEKWNNCAEGPQRTGSERKLRPSHLLYEPANCEAQSCVEHAFNV